MSLIAAHSEQERLAALDGYDILDTPREEGFDRITRLARAMFNVPMSVISLIDGHRQWFKSRQGLVDCETDRDHAMCYVAIREIDPLIVPDALLDERFKTNPFVIGPPHIRFYAGAQLRTPANVALGTLCIMDSQPRTLDHAQIAMLRDLAGVVMSELELRNIASIDSLTGSLSRRAFRDQANGAISLAIRHRHPLSCAVFDLDHFKSVNDTHGHAVGDAVLVKSVEACRDQLRGTDLLGRIGGEEFAVLLPHTDQKQAMMVAEKMRRAIEGLIISAASLPDPIKVSASFGVASLDNSARDVDELLKHADGALYVAKAAGRNRCMAWHIPDAPSIVPSTTMRRVLKAGKIAFNGGSSTIDCTVRGLSDVGASVEVNSSAGIPDIFKLQIDTDRVSRRCKIASKNDKRLEIQFE